MNSTGCGQLSAQASPAQPQAALLAQPASHGISCIDVNGSAGMLCASSRQLLPQMVGAARTTALGSTSTLVAPDSPLGRSAPSVAPSPRPPSPGPGVSLDDFEVLDCDAGRSLGKGSFGVVRRIRRKGSNDIYALKTMQKLAVVEGDLIDQVEREIQVQLSLKHENIVRLYMHFEDADHVYLLLEYCAKGELYQICRTQRGRRFSEDDARHYFVQVARGLRYLHSQCIIHRDLKPENLLVNASNVLKIADFGWCAFVMAGANRTTFCGTLDYLAPEMIWGIGHNHTVDIWSLGVLLYEMVVGRTPFQSTNHALLIHKITNLELRFPPFVPRGVSDLVTCLLQHNAQERMPLELVLRHPWTTGSVNGRAQSRDPSQREGSPGSPSSSPVRSGNSQLQQRHQRPEQQHQQLQMRQEQPQREPSPSSPVRTQTSMPPRQQQTNKASSRAASLSNDGATSAQAQKPHLQASPRGGRCTNTAAVGLAGRSGDKQGRCGSRPDRGSELLQQQQISSTPAASGLAPRQGALQSSMGRAHAQSTSAMPGCRAPGALQASTGGRLMQGTQVIRHNHSAPQTPVQQAPFRHVRSAGGVVSSRRFSGCGAGTTTAATSALTATTTTTTDGRRPSRRESPEPAMSPVRRPRSSGPSESQADLTNSRNSATPAAVSGVSTSSPKVRTARPHSSPTLSGPAAPPTPTNQHQQITTMAHSTAASQHRLQHRVTTANGGYQMPGSPKPCGAAAGRSLSPLGTRALPQAFAGGQRSAPIAGPRIAPGPFFRRA